jgi:hypothetical protein
VLNAAARASVRAALTQDDFYTLLLFAWRAALRTLRTKDPTPARAAINALSLIELKRVDPRDPPAGVALASYAISRVGASATASLERAASVSEPGMASVFARFAGEPVSLSDWLQREVETDEGVALVGDHGSRFAPTVDLLSISYAISAAVDADVWRVTDLSVGAEFSSVWLDGRNRRKVERALGSLRGCATVSAKLLPTASPTAHAQMLIAFIAQADSAQDAGLLSDSAHAASGGGHVAIGEARGPICVVVVSRSFYGSVESYERGESLERFRPAIRAALAEHVT